MNIDYKRAAILTKEIVDLKKQIIDFSNKHKLFSCGVVLPNQKLFVHWMVKEMMLCSLRLKENELSCLLHILNLKGK
ncbi:hypothetical protein AVENP_1485 [Arcobacter venerupis]|uniref:Uncharacterized protein n=1 Tax=Arcobacter venerupis TaxID=1054033 RepID=A0AAE7BAY6_9BACT|nr:hypothetical protein [Arcobacter venerupis]QKF67037.1 hypothetical protein AVENP_1485 [Arcobacter venerupis]RWS50017.1 hypothetical protein CKA56_05930 [Arcobacter venerupis]